MLTESGARPVAVVVNMIKETFKGPNIHGGPN